MTPTLSLPAATSSPPGYDVPFPDEVFPFDNDENMDSPWHRAQIELLIAILEFAWKGRRFFCGGNMFVHFSPKRARNKDFRGPDFFVVLGVDHDKPRLYWATWDEDGRTPDFILELLSPSTEREDRTTKKDIYERTLKTRELLFYDPETRMLEGLRLSKTYRPIPLEDGRIWSEELDLSLGTWTGTWDGHEAVWLRFFDRQGNMLPTGQEFGDARIQLESARAEAAEKEVERLRKEIESLRQQLQTPTS